MSTACHSTIQHPTDDYCGFMSRWPSASISNVNTGSGTFNNVGGSQYNHYYGPVFFSHSMNTPIDYQVDLHVSQSYLPTLSNIMAICELLHQFPSRTTPRYLLELLDDMKRFTSLIAHVAKCLDIINDISTGIRELGAFRQAHVLIRRLNAHLLVIHRDIHDYYLSVRQTESRSFIVIILSYVIAEYRWRVIYRRAESVLTADHLVLETFAHTICSGCWRNIITGEPAQRLEQLIGSSPLLKTPFVYHLRMLTITVRDHAGRRLPIPLEYCASWSDLRIVIKHLCHNIDGSEYINRDDWEIIRTSDNATLSTDRPLSEALTDEIASSDETFDLSIIMHALRASVFICPGCGYDNLGTQVPCNKWIACGQCQKTFQVISIALGPSRSHPQLLTDTPGPKRHILSAALRGMKKIIPSRWRDKGKIKQELVLPPKLLPVILTPEITNARFPRVSLRVENVHLEKYSVAVVKSLLRRVEDWKGLHVSNFGELLLDDTLNVTKSEIDRTYTVFLFEKVIVTFKPLQVPVIGKAPKNNLFARSPPGSPRSAGQAGRDETPLALKGRVFINNVTEVKPLDQRKAGGSATVYPLKIWWRSDHDLDDFTLHCQSEDQLKQWDSALQGLISEATRRRGARQGVSALQGYQARAI